MKPINQATILALALMSLTGCSGGDVAKEIQTDNSVIEKPLVDIIGSIEKGPFVVGSNVTINVLSDTGQNTESTILTKTIDKLGNFKFSVESEKLLQISATGYYLNEITGELSEGTVTLRSIYKSNGTKQQVANVNLLTHLASARALKLIENNGLQFEAALEQAEAEFLSAFDSVIPKPQQANFSNLSILEGSGQEASAYLLTVSALVYQYALDAAESKSTNPDAELTALLNELESDFAKYGDFSDKDALAELRASHTKIDPNLVKSHLLEWREDNQTIKIPDINVFLDTDLDGTPNSNDEDDDNDGIKDDKDGSPFRPDFNVTDKSVTLTEDTNVAIDVSANDPMGTSIDVVIESAPKFGHLSGVYPELLYIPNSDYTGQDSFTYKLRQEDAISDSVTVTLFVTAVNDAPEISGDPIGLATALDNYTFRPDYRDVDGDTLQFKIENLPNWAQFDASNGALQGTPNNSNAGIYSDIRISVTDGEYTASLPAFSIEVQYSQLAAPTTVQSHVSNAGYKHKIVALSWDEVDYAKSYDIELYSDESLTKLAYSANSTSNALQFDQALGQYFMRTRTNNPNNVSGAWSATETLDVGTFTRTIGGSGMDSVKSVLNVDDGQIILAHTTSVEVKEGVDSKGVYWLFKVDSNGDIQWQYFMETPNIEHTDVYSLDLLNDGSIAIIVTDSHVDYYLTLVSSAGQFVRTIEITPPNRGHNLGGFADTKFGTFVSFDLCRGWFCAMTSMEIHKLNLETGELGEAITLPTIDGSILANWYSLNTTKGGDLIVSGQLVREGENTSSANSPYIQIFDSTFNATFTWNGLESHRDMPFGKDVLELDNGDFVLAAQSWTVGFWVATVDRSTGKLSSYLSEEDTMILINGISPMIPSSNGILFAPHNLNDNQRKTQLIEFDYNLNKRSEVTIDGFGEQWGAGLLEHSDGGTTIVMTSKVNGKDSIVIIKR
ncbi:Ig-like domain-containing protein [Pseudoalteromonas luteoviolacea]|uniref:Dystroglycan-type cadherin-like domain-containing protein n=1 Tax=Pseudoalteromonas luteoviolacea DSM 6061 TaxID=1365250 RepID=A0A166WW20_9GAMM|nr:Ig-like domain-containing protein [Pseudoalteromonas luteoviolacea]KZN38142.1 hypothetical protein N475_16055 [Pseudoalteromonas luteoviolacea DSM 6061]MBE0388833.1 hypothetical protein [Pseudoalteromonas luteoviolacea DSM 6061]